MDRRDFIKNALTLAALLPLSKLCAVNGSIPPISADLLFTNVELYDGTGKDPFMADVAVKNDMIIQVAPSGTLNCPGANWNG